MDDAKSPRMTRNELVDRKRPSKDGNKAVASVYNQMAKCVGVISNLSNLLVVLVIKSETVNSFSQCSNLQEFYYF